MLMAGCGRAPKAEGDGPKMEFVRIPAGTFYMGWPDAEESRDDDEGRARKVRITEPFYMGKYEVTQTQWKAVMRTTSHVLCFMGRSDGILQEAGPQVSPAD